LINIKKGEFLTDRIGETKTNTYGSVMTIINYRGARDIDIYFQDSNYTTTNREYRCFVEGKITNPYDKEVLGVGYFGEGKYKSNEIKSNGKSSNTKQYDAWRHMLQRGYDTKLHIKRPTYIGCTVCEEWHCFQTFAKWYDNNYYEFEGYKMHLDKDILIKGNRIYSPETAIFVPSRINTLFLNNNNHRGKFPLGVSLHCLNYTVNCADGSEPNNMIYLGTFKTPEKAFGVYKIHKEQVIKNIADKYKDKIPEKLYNAMYKYEVEITD